jgi:hypothetical protein
MSDLGVHVAPIPVFTFDRSGRSRSTGTRTTSDSALGWPLDRLRDETPLGTRSFVSTSGELLSARCARAADLPLRPSTASALGRQVMAEDSHLLSSTEGHGHEIRQTSQYLVGKDGGDIA